MRDTGREQERLGVWGPIIILRTPWQRTSESMATVSGASFLSPVVGVGVGGSQLPRQLPPIVIPKPQGTPSLASSNYASWRLICKETARQLF